jgi:Uma2 family endonuclease
MTVQLTPPTTYRDATVYPESDGKPMAESDLHREIMVYIIHLLQRWLKGQQVYVSGNLLLYYEEGNPRKVVAPDCFVVWGVTPQRRLIYKLWEEGKTPGVVFEVTSKSTKREDWVTKMALYARLGVQEYYLYDPTGDYLRPTLQAFQLQGKDYLPMSPANQAVQIGELSLAPAVDEPPEYVSPLLGLRLAVNEAGWLVFYDEATGQRLLNDDEARLRAEEDLTQAEAARLQVEEENARLREELARLRGELS